ncbi:PAS domain S-box protein [Methylobacterium sp. WL9]|uniref:PAS domain S-box protein n=1 Tax=Methylobacterium sp. WL9 TaxID=2603898 RepID=UPI0011C730B8|nr:PAS domain S-box protein [Methylobacterium sp. WL9]TXN19662.1 PAS domain S-box protein [Methylobacterium sp. WL9]
MPTTPPTDRPETAPPETAAPETARLAALDRYGILDTPAETGFDDIVALASEICGTPVALVSLVTGDRQWFKARVGFDPCETPIAQSVCAHALEQPGLLVIPDLTQDPRTRDNTLVTGAPFLRFYAGARLETPEGAPIGTLCVIDHAPRPGGLAPRQAAALERLARQVMGQMALRRAVAERDDAVRTLREAGTRHRQILDSAVDYAIVTMDLDGIVTSWNLGAERIVGWTAAEMCGRPADAFFTPEDVAAGIPEREMRAAREVGRGADARWRRRKDGSPFFGLGEMMPLRAADGTLVGYLKILRDRTEQHRADARSRAAEEALAASEERMRLAVEATGIGIFDYAPQTDVLRWDERVRDLFGVGPDEAVTYAGSYLAGLHPDDRAAADAAVRAATDPAGTGMFDIEYRVRPRDGAATRWLAARGKSTFADGRQTRFVGTVRDVTVRKTAELAVRATEERYRLVTRATNDAIWDWDLVSNHVLWNESLHSAYGYDLATVGTTGEWWLDHVHPDDRARVEADIRSTIAGTEDEWSHEYRFRRADGTVADVLDRGYMVRGKRGEPIRMIGAMLDLTERKRDERRLHAMNAMLEERVEERTRERDRTWSVSQDLMVVIDAEGVFRAVSPAATRILGWLPEEMLGCGVRDFVHPEDGAVTAEAIAHAAGQALPPFENRYRHKDGGYRWMSWVSVPEGALIYATGRHVTAEKEQAQALSRAEEALRQSQKMEAVGQLTGGLAHDFNNLLTGISGSLELLQNRVSQGRLTEIDRYVNAAQGAAKRAAALTHRLLAFSRRQTLDPKPTDVNRLVAGMEDLVRRTIGPEITLEVVASAGLWPAMVDPSQLENALLNLCINARDAMPDGGRITIETANRWLETHAARERDLEPGQYLSLCVSDSGTGMSADVIAKAFEPFFTTKPIGQGTGLGLSMIYGFARQSGGQVRIYSEVGTGTTLCIYLPRHYGPAEEGDAAPDLSAAPRGEQGQTVLVVDDEPTVRMLVAEVLEDLGYTAIEAADGSAGLKLLRSDIRVDLLVTDVGLPGGMNGRQMADAARVTRPGLKVLFITGYAENAVLGNGYLEPGMQVLTKPFVMEALASRIKDLIAKG